MLQGIFYSAIGLSGAALALLIGYRKKTYHGFMVHQCNIRDDEYDQIYKNR
jgi:hypothetical protein